MLAFPTIAWATQGTCDRYASPSGGGTGLSAGSPYQIANFWSDVVVGTVDTLCLADGTYTGANSNINPPTALAGNATNQIWIICPNEGACLIDGGSARKAVDLNDVTNDWYVLEGFNARNGSSNVIDVQSDNVTFRRVCAWNADPNDIQGVWEFAGSDGFTCEDCCGFGSGRNVYSGKDATNATTRRGWFRYEGYNLTNTCKGIDIHRDQEFNGIWENVLTTFWFDSQYSTACTNRGPMGTAGVDPPIDGGNKLLGSISYVLNGQLNGDTFQGGLYFRSDAGGWTIKDFVVFINDGSAPGALMLNSTNMAAPGTYTFENWTTIADTANTFQSDYPTPTNIDTCVPPATNCSSIFTSSTGAQVCNKYVDGILTNEPLWPWPMNQRIIDATTTLNAARVSDVTDDIETAFGAIPDVCRTDVIPSDPPRFIWRGGVFKGTLP